jgi:hypothetical protein
MELPAMNLFYRVTCIATMAVGSSFFASPQSNNPRAGEATASPADLARSMLATELPPPAKFFTEPTGSGGSECYVNQPFSANGDTLTTRVSVATQSPIGNITATVLRHNDRDGENTHDQTIIVRLLDAKGKVKSELFARRDADNVEVCTAPGGFMKTCSQHPTIGKWVSLADAEISQALQGRREAALKACLVKHKEIQGRHDTDAELGTDFDKPTSHR